MKKLLRKQETDQRSRAAEETEKQADAQCGGERRDRRAQMTAEKKRLLWKEKEGQEEDTQIEELTDRLKRQMAEFDNFRKTDRERKIRHV